LMQDGKLPKQSATDFLNELWSNSDPWL
jgi:hypothetical protein